MSYTLFKRQKEIEAKLLAGSAVLNWDMRLGKTRAVLHAFNQLTFNGGPTLCVVVCPSIAKGVWENENMEMGLDLPTIVLDGITKKRTKGEEVGGLPLLIILNWDIVDAYLPELQRLFAARRCVLVLDETHEHCCNPRNARYKAVRDLALGADRTWILTGTLYRTTALDYHWQLRLLGPRHYPWYYDSTNSFGEKFCKRVEQRIVIPGGPRKGQVLNKLEWKGILPGTEAALVQLPVIDRRLEELTELPTELTWWLDEGDKWAYRGGEEAGAMSRARGELSELKADRTIELIRRNNLLDGPLVIFGWHKRFIDRVSRELVTAGYRVGVIDGDASSTAKTSVARSFAAGHLDVVIGNIRSAGMSVDLASARNAVFGEIDWVAATMRQAEARIRGPKQKQKPCYWYVLAMNSVDEFVWRTMLGRGRDMKRLDAAQLAG